MTTLRVDREPISECYVSPVLESQKVSNLTRALTELTAKEKYKGLPQIGFCVVTEVNQDTLPGIYAIVNQDPEGENYKKIRRAAKN